MQRLVQTLTCLFLAMALLLAGPGGISVAKGATLVEVCAGDMIDMVWLDADGNPVDRPAGKIRCLDCLAFDIPPPAVPSGLVLSDPLRAPIRLWPEVALRVQPVAHLRPDPRGPPAQPAYHRCDADLRHHDRWSLPQSDASKPDQARAEASLASGRRADK